MNQTDKETATVCQKTPEYASPSEETLVHILPAKPRNYDDAMVEDLAKTHAQTLVKLDKANAHADKLAEALRDFLALDFAKSTMSDIAPVINKAVAQVQAYEEAKQ